ncbi:hypothetical protein HAX54_003789 [Datura stramonium]|uniref:Uncharacterized protein n=1 Tax=Datura stramonium TaxID=4076 RepID=A0ABS8WUY0_DATST|nr:hypothetical protein [Datura stramonium]
MQPHFGEGVLCKFGYFIRREYSGEDRGIMTSKGKEVVFEDPSVKRARKGQMGASSSSFKAIPVRRFGAKCLVLRAIWFNTQKEDKYALENWIDDGLLAPEFPSIRDKIRVGSYLYLQ